MTSIFFDWILIVLSSIFTFISLKKICFIKNCSIANFIICIIYVFCVTPILFNYIIGIPDYNTAYWYKVFVSSMRNETISVIYDLYIFFTILLLFLYSNKFIPKEITNPKMLFFNTKPFCLLITISPFIYIMISGTINNYFTYNTQSLRGFDINNSNYFTMLMALIFLSMFTYYSNYFKERKNNLSRIVSFSVYNFLIIWVVGKRFIFANIAITILFYLSQIDISVKKRKKMFKLIPILLILLLCFSSFYLKVVRPLSDTSTDSIYEMLRVDFGRDDVIKYTIEKELIKNERILEYRGQTFVGLLTQLVPRKVWHNKPYPHYMYLTSSILDLKIDKLPAGTTPSYLEMTISNFGSVGLLVGAISMLLFCYFIDKIKNIDIKFIFTMLLVILLTQSMDIYIIYIFIILIYKILELMLKLRLKAK